MANSGTSNALENLDSKELFFFVGRVDPIINLPLLVGMPISLGGLVVHVSFYQPSNTSGLPLAFRWIQSLPPKKEK
uniref:Uncharacterized protein n=1 Tax=Utricularia reniformis TaxID=192314 RepID=A0A1Y0AZ64_9LAMI|nr:hypothetical protein AEK19_MT2087 [Utricularia reniformis]ART30430.1 hypothetical protein AEK19_MT2087 [Utricularia reniformis]